MKETIVDAWAVVGEEGRALLAREVEKELKLRALGDTEHELMAVWCEFAGKLKGATLGKAGYGEWEILECVTLALGSGFKARRKLIEEGLTIG